MSLVAVVMAAGKGTRMRSERPKVLHELLYTPMLAYTYRVLREVGIVHVLTVVGHRHDDVERVAAPYSDWFDTFAFVVQKPQLGTGHAVMVTRDLAERHEHVLVLNGDVPCLTAASLGRFFAAHEASEAGLSAMTTLLDDPMGFGRVVRDRDNTFVKVVEHEDALGDGEILTIREINGGIYLAEGHHLFNLLDSISNDNAQGEYYLPDVLGVARSWGRPPHLHVEADPALLSGINTRRELLAAERLLLGRVHDRLLDDGVTLLSPDLRVAPDAHIGPDTVIHPGVELRAGCVVGAGVEIETGAILTDTRVDDGAHVLPYSVLESAHVGPDCRVGPFARLRPGAELARGARVGNFVEIKKSRLGEGAKANHLSYIGDADVGRGANVGAGTITCNYDGYGKHRTVIEDEVLIGSDTQLVAPVRVGARAVIGAGTTVTADVPAGSLAISRPQQQHVEGYRARLAARYSKDAEG